MSLIVTRPRWTRQPLYPAAPNPAYRLGLLWTPSLGVDVVRGAYAEPRGSGVFTGTANGFARRNTTTSNYNNHGVRFSAFPQLVGNGFSIIAFLKWNSSVDSFINLYVTGTGTAGVGITTSGQLRSATGAGSTYSTSALSSGQTAVIGYSHVPGRTDGKRFYINGVQDATTATTVSDYEVLFDSNAIQIGGADSYGSIVGDIFLVAKTNRALTPQEHAEIARNPWQLFAPVSRRVFYSLASGASPQSLTATRLTNTSTYGTAVVSRGAVSLSPTKYTNTNTFGTAVVGRGAVTLTATKFTNGSTFGTAVVSRGAVTLTPTKVSNANTFGTATVSSGSSVITPTKYTNASTFGTAVVGRGAVSLTPTQVTNSSTFGTASVTAKATLSPSKVTNTSTFGTPVVGRGAVTLSPSKVTNSNTFGTPVVAVQGAVFATLFQNTSTFYTPSIVRTGDIVVPSAGGWSSFGNTRRKSAAELEAERVRFGVLPAKVQKALKRAVRQVVEKNDDEELLEEVALSDPSDQIRAAARAAIEQAQIKYRADYAYIVQALILKALEERHRRDEEDEDPDFREVQEIAPMFFRWL